MTTWRWSNQRRRRRRRKGRRRRVLKRKRKKKETKREKKKEIAYPQRSQNGFVVGLLINIGCFKTIKEYIVTGLREVILNLDSYT